MVRWQMTANGDSERNALEAISQLYAALLAINGFAPLAVRSLQRLPTCISITVTSDGVLFACSELLEASIHWDGRVFIARNIATWKRQGYGPHTKPNFIIGGDTASVATFLKALLPQC